MLKNEKYKSVIPQTIKLLVILFLVSSCSSDDAIERIPTGQSKQYVVFNTDLSDITGIVNFIENTDGSTTISLELIGTDIDNPVRLRRNTAYVGGGVAANLNLIEPDTGRSSTTLNKLDNGEEISYADLIEFEGYIAIEGNGENEGVLFAYADLGPNELTGDKVTYNLLSPEGAIDGQINLEKRKKGTTALTIGLFTIDEGVELFCALHILQNNSEEYIHELSPITDKLNGFGFNELTEIDGVAITYEEVLELNAYIEVSNENNSSTFIAKGEIGINAN